MHRRVLTCSAILGFLALLLNCTDNRHDTFPPPPDDIDREVETTAPTPKDAQPHTNLQPAAQGDRMLADRPIGRVRHLRRDEDRERAR